MDFGNFRIENINLRPPAPRLFRSDCCSSVQKERKAKREPSWQQVPNGSQSDPIPDLGQTSGSIIPSVVSLAHSERFRTGALYGWGPPWLHHQVTSLLGQQRHFLDMQLRSKNMRVTRHLHLLCGGFGWLGMLGVRYSDFLLAPQP